MFGLAHRCSATLLGLFLIGTTVAFAQDAKAAAAESASSGASEATKVRPKSKLEMLTDGLKEAGPSDGGLFKLWYNDQKLLGVIKASDLGREFLVLPSIAKGISRGMVLGGMSWGFEDDVLWTFRKVGENIHVIRRNVRFTANPNTPEADSVSLAYSDSVLYSLPVLTEGAGGYVVDFGRLFMNDDLMIGRAIGSSFRFVSERSTWAKVKSFSENIELELTAVYSGFESVQTVADPRGVQVNVHYSISRLPSSDYRPRRADDRVGYFVTAIKNFSDKEDDENFVRYINRWNLKKETKEGTLSAPSRPIVFFIEKTVPLNLRPYVMAGILEWNKAFEKLGYYNAIQVMKPGDVNYDVDAVDPEDVRYNFFRWITAEAGFAMGPSRVNPKTGQILDADIIFDDSFLRYWKQDYETFTPDKAAKLFGRPAEEKPVARLFDEARHFADGRHLGHECMCSYGMQHQMAFGASVLMAEGKSDEGGKLPDEFVHQALKEVVMHEVGHTLGLRHNFKASAWKDLTQISDKSKGENEATVASVMDYSPANIVPAGATQGFYFTPTIGPYDHWAIEYGYKDVSGDEKAELNKIAARGAEAGLHYATDEDTRYFDSDPLTNTFDLGSNPVEFADRQMKLSGDLLPKVIDRAVKNGEGFQRARQAFGVLFSEYWRSALFAARFPGGVYVNRDHKGDPNARAPFELVDAKKQREAMKLLADHAFASPTYDPKVLNHLAATRWYHWGVRDYLRLDYPIHEFVQIMQEQILFRILNPITLERLRDNEVKTAADADRYTLAEHMRLTVESIFSEWKGEGKTGEYTDKAPYIPSFRRNLQRMTLIAMADLITSKYRFFVADGKFAVVSPPEDARTLARMHLTALDQQITALLAKNDLKLDDYSRAHLLDSQKRIQQVLNAQLDLPSVD